MERIQFLEKGGQRKFFDEVIENINAVSLRGLLQFGFDINYSTLKNYYSESRLLPKELFEDLCLIGKVDKEDLRFKTFDGSWGQVKGGKKGKRKY